MSSAKTKTTAFLIFYSIIFLSIHSSPAQQAIFLQPLSDRIASYDMNVKLDPVKKLVTGEETLYWKNTSTDKINELEFHLYLNAFKNTNSTFIKESGGQLREDKFDESSNLNWGWEKVISIKEKDGEDLTDKIKYIQPDDNNKDDQTVISVPLSKSVMPGQTITLNIKFESKLPKVFARSGFNDDFFLVGQWFPKIGVYEKAGERYAVKGQWNCHQYHANSEFYADFGVYNVHITVPKNYIVGAVGVLQNEMQNEDGTKTLFYHAEDVIDFAWTASPSFKAAEAVWHNVKIRVLLQPEHFSQTQRHIQSVEDALEYFDKYLGKYPYPNLTIVDPPFRAMGAAGMEYPTFFTGGSLWGLPEGIKITESTVVHEFGHNYFMGMLATNEFEEAWMDEGFNSYYEARVMDHYYGKQKSFMDFMGFHFGDGEMQREGYVGMKDPEIDTDFQYSWKFKNNGSYGGITYYKTSTWMFTLEGLVGRKVMDEIMQTYFDRWKFKHPCGNDFIAIVNKVVKERLGNKFGDNMDWFFNEVLYGTDICDYKLSNISIEKVEQPRGAYDSAGVEKYFKIKRESEKPIYESKVDVERLGGVVMPEEVLVHFDNGKEVLETWDGKDRSHEFIYDKPEKVVWAKVDPHNKIPIDVNLINNSYTTEPKSEPENKYFVKFLFWVENTMLFLGSLF